MRTGDHCSISPHPGASGFLPGMLSGQKGDCGGRSIERIPTIASVVSNAPLEVLLVGPAFGVRDMRVKNIAVSSLLGYLFLLTT